MHVPDVPPNLIMQPSSQNNRSISGDSRHFTTKCFDDDISSATPKASNVDQNKVVKMSETELHKNVHKNEETAALRFAQKAHDAVIRGIKESLPLSETIRFDVLLGQYATIIKYADLESLYPFIRKLYRYTEGTQSSYARAVWFEQLEIKSNGEEIGDPLPYPFGDSSITGRQRRLPGMVTKLFKGRRAISPRYRFTAMVNMFKKNVKEFDAIHQKSLTSVLFTCTLISAWKKDGSPPPDRLTVEGSRGTERTGGNTMTDRNGGSNGRERDLNNQYLDNSTRFNLFAQKVHGVPNSVVVRTIHGFLVQSPPSTAHVRVQDNVSSVGQGSA